LRMEKRRDSSRFPISMRFLIGSRGAMDPA